MARVLGKIEFLSTDLQYFKGLQGLDGKTLFERFKLAETNVINKYIDIKYRDFLAYPVQENGLITFHIKKFNETPRPISDLEGSDWEKYLRIKDETITHYNNKIFQLRGSEKTDEAEFLNEAIKFIDDRFLYCYDERVVLVIWGMTLKTNVRKDLSEICKFVPFSPPPPPPLPHLPTPPPPTGDPIDTPFTITYSAGSNGNLIGNSSVVKQPNELLSAADIPKVEPKEGHEFIGWDTNPEGYEVTGNREFTAQYRATPPIPPDVPWYIRFWNWLRLLFVGRGCLKWLLWLLLFLILLFIIWLLLRRCDGLHLGDRTALIGRDSTWVREDPRVGDEGGIYDPGNPYTPVPTPPGYEDVLPPEQGVLPSVPENPEIIPGNPTIFSNRLNILMENEGKSILDLAKEFKVKYPDDKYKVVYYDNVVKRLQIEIPSEEREQLKQTIPGQFKPEYELFVFDEALFEGMYTPDDPAFSDQEKVWYLNVIHAQQAWDITLGSEKVTVAIVDNGFNLKHPELSNKVIQPYNVWKHSDEIFPQQIDHGTHVAGIALANANNAKGLSGIAPKCKFMPIQVADAKGIMTTTSVLDGILYALYQGADVVNISLGSQFSSLSQLPESAQRDLIKNHFREEERLWREIMRIAAKHNSTVVTAAGNDNVLAGIDAIQRPELFITVSATDKNNKSLAKANFSNYGSFSTISAPGVGIYSTVGSNGYETMDGTSMSAPIVSGAVALLKSVNDTITTRQIICVLQATGKETQGNVGKLIQLDKALQQVKSGKIVDCNPSPSSGDVQVLLSWNNFNDLDLICTDPFGESVFFRNRRVSSGGQLEIDMNVEYPDSKTPIENIFWEPGAAPNGTYNIYLMYYRRHEPAIDETPYNIKVKYGGKTDDYNGMIKKADNTIHICTFSLGLAGNMSQDSVLQTPNLPPSDERRSVLERERDRLLQELDRVNSELRRLGNQR